MRIFRSVSQGASARSGVEARGARKKQQKASRIARSREFVRTVGLFCLFLSVISILLSVAAPASAAEDKLDQDLQNGLADSAVLVDVIQTKLAQDQSAGSELARLRGIADNIRLTNLLLEERFRQREEKAKTIASSARDRQRTMTEGYRKALTEYLAIIDSLPPAGDQQKVRKLRMLLDRVLPRKNYPLIGTLPYRHLNLPAIEPATAPAVLPAYNGGDRTIHPEDTAATPEAPLSAEIASLAQSLGWNPVNIYEYVKNSIETEWYWGCMKGAEETLHQKSGNDCDQATLLVALLRASGYPSRYVQGAIEFFPDVARAKNLTGIETAAGVAELFRKAGIPNQPVIAGGKVSNIRFEHIWVETQVPYANYRGALIDENGKTWLGLDTSIKVKGYEYSTTKDLFGDETVSGQLTALRDEYLGALQTKTPLEYLKERITSISSQEDPNLTSESYKLTRTLIPEHMKILPASLQFTAVDITKEYAAIPEELKHKVRFVARTAENSELLNYELDVQKLSNRQVMLTFEPETVEDQKIIDSFGGLDSTPAYMVRLRPVLKVDGERKIVAQDGLAMGAEFNLSIELLGPGMEPEKTTNRMIMGSVAAIGIVAGRTVQSSQFAVQGEQTAEGLLYQEAMNYIDRWNRSEDELASLMHLVLARPLPTVATVGNLMDVTYVLDLPHQMTWKGVYCDADVRRVEAVPGSQFTVPGDREKIFMQLSSLEGSVLEHRLFEDDFGVESVSTAKLFELCAGDPTLCGDGILTIDKTNIDSLLPTLVLDDMVKADMTNAVNQGYQLRTVNSALTYDDWTGMGYIKENVETGESGWMLSGMIAGGSSALSPENWANQSLAEIFSHPLGGKANTDPLSAAKLLRITAVNMQRAAAGKPVEQLLMAFAVDSMNKPVKGAKVTFAIRAGGGKVRCFKEDGGMTEPAESCTSPTETMGIASAQLIVGEHTSDNPAYIKLNESDLYETQIGINIVEASVAAHAGEVNIDSPFEAYGLPDVQGAGKRVETVFPLGVSSSKTINGVTVTNTDIPQSGMPNNPGGSLLARLVDKYGNPISNAQLRFFGLDMASQDPKVPLPQTARNVQFYNSATCSVAYPLYGECGAQAYAPESTAATDYNGAKADFVYGNTVNTMYTIQVSAPAYTTVPPSTWTVHIAGYADSPNVFFDSSLKIGSLDLYNTSGALVNAAKAGDELKGELKAKLFSTGSDYTVDTQTETCLYGGQQVSCSRVRPAGTVKTTKIADGEVVFATSTGTGKPITYLNAGDGLYTSHFLTAKTPEKNVIDAQGTATLNVPVIFFDKDKNSYVMLTGQSVAVQLQTGQTAYFDIKAGKVNAGVCVLEQGTNETVCVNTSDPKYLQKTRYTAYGIGVDLAVEPTMVLLDDRNFTTQDMKLNYTIQPPDYSALAVDLDIYKKPSGGQETLVTVLYGDKTQGQWSSAFARGSVFDASTLYTAEAVLNPGSDMEVKGPEKRVQLPVVMLRVKDDQDNSVDEIKFGNGGRADKKYKIELISAALAKNCGDPSGFVRTVLKSGETASTPGDAYYPPEYALTFEGPGTVCSGRIGNKDRFIISNLSKDGLAERAAELKQKKSINVDLNALSALYGGLGNRIALSLGTTRLKDVRTEPVGVFVFGIDGLRQDVLYPAQVTSTSTVTASYSDPTGCGGGSCFIAPTHLTGLCEVLGGSYGSTCDTTGMMEKHIKLPDVTAIFPSITFASWASIFTGKLPKDTGILGNEFFARDLYDKKEKVIGLNDYPYGMVTLDADGGAFRPREGFLASPRFALKYAIPSEFLEKSYSGRLALSAPTAVLKQMPLWADIGNLVGAKYQTKSSEDEVCENTNYECKTVSIFNQYPDGVDQWGTGRATAKVLYDAVSTMLDGAVLMDSAATERTVDFIEDYFKKSTVSGKRKRFPALFSVYLAGLDHNAHLKGMSDYPWYFTQTTDMRVQDIVKALKDQDEFDNKIFIVVADHGHTAMPEGLTKTDKKTGKQSKADTSCELKVKDFDDPETQNPELANNNLHIWELAELFKTTGDIKGAAGLSYAVMAPTDIADLYTHFSYGAKRDTNTANVIAALNGPMAHIYVKNQATYSWNTPRLVEDIGYVAELLRLSLSKDKTQSNLSNLFVPGLFERAIPVTAGLKRLLTSIDTILIRRENGYEVFQGITSDGTDVISKPLNNYAGFNLSKYVKALTRINGMNHPDRSGDIVLLMKDEMDISIVPISDQRFTTGAACKSWHGSLNESDSFVPLIMSYPGGNTSELVPLIDNTHGCSKAQGCDGNWRVRDLIKTIIQKEYSIQ